MKKYWLNECFLGNLFHHQSCHKLFQDFFLMWAILKAFIKVVKILFQLHILVFWAERHVGS